MQSASAPASSHRLNDPDADADSTLVRHGDNSQETYFNFWLGTRRVAARGKPCNHHTNVIFLRVLPSTLSRLVHCLVRIFPASWRERLEAWSPEWFLPNQIIMKREKPGWQDEFDNELDIYGTLAPLGGRVVPKLYGQAEYPGTDGVRRRALIMSDIGGIPLGEAEVGSLSLDRVEEMMKDAFQALADAGVGHGDPKLDNMHVVGDKIMLIDFDTSYRIEDAQPELWVLGAVSHALRMYKSCHQRNQPR
ncbi:hypothetical protein QBC47DRAFT_395615 [Echria macrotheca]|uniref:Protein kinase domain-containing protein n=1 Tax=Echria macrotheca TaxID=438768 RepID=A0AAJ0B570_9PEZI|nr:hypothetical protein QBC47DRAFT_395615 [Echria macrotheca]